MKKKELVRKPTHRDFEDFKKEFLRCVELLQLGEWHIVFEFGPLSGDFFAELTWDVEGYIATVQLNSTIHKGIDAKSFDPKRSARHEAGHLFIARLESYGKYRYIIPDMFTTESERIARTLEKIL